MRVVDWLSERRDNCLRFANEREGEEREGWLEDAAYFDQAIQSLKENDRSSEIERQMCLLKIRLERGLRENLRYIPDSDKSGHPHGYSVVAIPDWEVRQILAGFDSSVSPEPNAPLRMHIALKVLRAWNSGTAGFDGEVVHVVNSWIDGGMKGPIPFPQSPFFADWAQANGYSNVDGCIGWRFEVQLAKEVPPEK